MKSSLKNQVFRSISLGLVFCCGAYTQEQTCTKGDSERALAEASGLRTWEAIYKSYSRYRGCDDGATAEGYSESVARVLVEHWSTLPRLAELAESDPRFRRFVLKHIDSTLGTEDLSKMRTMAKTQCPGALHSVCANLAREADAALKGPAVAP